MLATDDSSRPGYRGKCLYKTGKCNNERALKTSGQAHNLCDEHRHRQNEHQRKLDAKNRYARKDKADGKDASPTNMGSNGGGAQRNNRYMPYGKVRMSPGGGTAGAGGTMTDDMHAMLSRGLVPPNLMQFHAMADGVSPAASATASQMVGMSMASGAPQDIVPNGVVILPNGPQAPQMPYQLAMQDFDGIVVPLPSYLEGHERLEFRSRIFQKVMDFIAEECMRRFGAPPTAMAKAHDAPTTTDTPHEAVASNGDDASNKSRPRTGETTDSDGSSSSNNNTNEKKSPAHDDEIKDADDAAGEVGDADNSSRNKRASRGRVVRKDV